MHPVFCMYDIYYAPGPTFTPCRTKNRPGQITRPMPIKARSGAESFETLPIFLARTFCLAVNFTGNNTSLL